MGSGAFGMSPVALQSSSKGASALVWVVIVGVVLVVFLLAGIGIMVVLISKRAPEPPPVAASGDDNPNLEAKPDDAGAKPIATATPPPRTSPTVPFPTVAATTNRAPPFSRSRAVAAVDSVAAGAQSCHVTGDPTGVGSMRVDFEPNGNVATLTRKPFAFTTTGECVSARMRAIRLGPFEGKSNESVEATFVIRPPTTPTPSSSTRR